MVTLSTGTARRRVCAVACLLFAAGLAPPSPAAVLPEERADILYHAYSGDNVTVDGPSVLMRKNFAEKFSVFGNYYVDSVTSASIDVQTSGASEYSEERTQTSFGVQVLQGNSSISLSATNSDENDYTGRTTSLNISQDVFGNMTTVTLGFARGADEVRRNGDQDFAEEIDRRTYRLGVSQVVTKNMMLGFSWETISDEGFLNNPYRSVRFLNDDGGWDLEPEVYPRTRTSDAASIRGRYFLPYRAAVHAEYRFFTDSWGIDASTAEIGYTHPLQPALILEFRYRSYSQTAADFYSDLFPRAGAFNFRARDKELATFTSQLIGVGVSWDFARSGWKFVQKGSLNLQYDHMIFDYEDFRDLRVTDVEPGMEPLFNFDAGVIRAFVSIWF